MSKILNPEFTPNRALGQSDEAWATLKAVITVFLQQTDNIGQLTIEIADVRALDIQLDDDLVWAQISGEMGLIEIP